MNKSITEKILTSRKRSSAQTLDNQQNHQRHWIMALKLYRKCAVF